MHPWDEINEKNWPEIDDALHTAPVAPPPPGLYTSVMHNLENAETLKKSVSFLSWFDVAFSLFAGAMVYLFFVLSKLIVLYPEVKLTFDWLYQWMTVPSILLSMLGALFMTVASMLLAMVMLFVWRE